MSQVALHDPANATEGAKRGLMAALWRSSLQSYVGNDPRFGYRLRTDFVSEQFTTSNGTTAQITGTTAVTAAEGWTGQDAVEAGGTYSAVLQATPDGVLRIASNGTTADYGVELGRPVAGIVAPSHASLARGRLVCQIRLDEVAVNGQTLAVLTDAAYNTPIAGVNDAIADVGYVGFQVRENGDLYFVTKSAAAGTTDSVLVLAAASYVRGNVHNLGFAINRDQSVDIVVDGIWYGAAGRSISRAALPTGTLAPRLACTSSGTTAASMDLDSVDIFVENIS